MTPKIIDEAGSSQDFYSSLFQTMQIAMVVHDAEQRILACNPKAQKLLGVTETQAKSMSVDDPRWKFLRADGEKMSQTEFPVARVLSTKHPVRDLVVGVCCDSNGEPVWVLVNAEPVLNDKQEIYQIIVTFIDFTERRRVTKALQASEVGYRDLFESNPHPMWVYDLDTLAFLSVNNAAISHYGYSREEFLAMTIKDIRPGEDVPRLLENVDRVTFGIDKAGIWRHIRKDGSIIEVEITSHELRFDQRPAEMVMAHDVTDRIRVEREQVRLQSQLAQAQKMESVGRLAGGVAHDFNNMLGVILGHTELAMEHLEPNEPLHLKLQEIRLAAERSADLTRQLLAFARKQTIAPRVLDLNQTVTETLKMIGRLIGEDIELTWIPGEMVSSVKIDPAQVDQILTNLCVNARDAIKQVGQITIETADVVFDDDYCAHHTGFLAGEYSLLAVSDNGCGMDRETLDSVFEPFFTTKGMSKGTGLGLATVYGIVKQNKGFVNVYSELDKGTTIKIYLPAYDEKISETDTIRRDSSLAEARGYETILLTEDEPALLEMVSTMLKFQQYNVLAAPTPREAIAVANEFEGDIHLLMTDVVMPGMNGRELAENLLSIYPQMRCLFMSGYTANVIANRGVLDEGVNFIQKPFSMLDMATKVRQILD